MSGSKPRILLFDLETFPNVVTSWGLRVDGYLSPENIIEERTIICASYKWLGERKVYSVAIDPENPTDDRAVVEALHKVLSEADATITHNGDKFDTPWVNARMACYGLAPLPPTIQIDTKKIAKNKFYFNSNKLVYLAEFLKVGKKIKTEFELWKDCRTGDKKALAKMVKYCRRDVVILERIYNKLAPYVPARINHRLFSERPNCESCGSRQVQSRGFVYTTQNKYRRFQCVGCGYWFRARKAEKSQ